MSSYSAQQSSISENNRSRILQYLYHNGISSRAQIAKAIELTPAAITKNYRKTTVPRRYRRNRRHGRR